MSTEAVPIRESTGPLVRVAAGTGGRLQQSYTRAVTDDSLFVPGTLTVEGQTTLNGSTDIAGDLNVSGAANFTGAVVIGTNTLIQGSLIVEGTINGGGGGGGSGIQQLVAGTNILLDPETGFGQAVTVGLRPALTGLTGVSVSGNLEAGANVNATANGNFGGDLTVSGNIDASSAHILNGAAVDGTLTAGALSVGSTANVGGLLTAANGLTVTTGTVDALSSTLNAATGNFSAGVNVTGTLAAQGAATVGSKLSVVGDISGGSLHVITNAAVGNDLTVAGKITVADLIVTDGFDVSGAFQADIITANTNMYVLGNLDISGTIYHTGLFSPAIVTDISAGVGIQVSRAIDNPSVFIISAPDSGGGGGGPIYNAGSNIEITGSDPYTINVAIGNNGSTGLDMKHLDIKNVDVIELVTTSTNALDPRISFIGGDGDTERARLEYNDDVTRKVLKATGPIVEIEASGGQTTLEGVKLIAGTNTMTVTTDRVVLDGSGAIMLDISGIEIKRVGTDLVIDNTHDGDYKVVDILDVSGDATYQHILAYSVGNGGTIRKIPVPDDVDVSGGTNISVTKVGTVTYISQNITQNVDMNGKRLTEVGGIDLSGGSAIDVSGDDLTLRSDGVSFLTLKGAGGMLLEGVADTTVAPLPRVLGYDPSTNVVAYQNDTSSEWITRYLISQPDAPSPPTTGLTSAEILITWATNPTQIPVSFQAAPLPNIAALKVKTTIDGADNTYTNTASLPGAVDTTTAVRGVVFIKNTGVNGIVSRTVNSTAVNVYAIYLGTGFSSPPFIAEIWYEGYGDTSAVNKLTLTGLAFNAGGAPSVVQNVGSTALTSTTVTITYAAPQFSDATNQLTPPNPAITQYNITYTPTGNSFRYQGAYNLTPISTTATAPPSKALTDLFPDTDYSVSVSATNSFGLTGPSGVTTFTMLANPTLAPNLFIDAATITVGGNIQYNSSQNYLNATGVQLSAPIYFAAPVLGTPSAIPFITGQLSIHVSDTRGSSSAGIMKLSANINGGTNTQLLVGGFGTTTGTATGAVSIVSSGARSDAGTLQNSNFYQKQAFQIQTNGYSADRTVKNTIALIQEFPASGTVTAKNASRDFYTDDFLAFTAPSVTSISFGTPTLTSATSVTGLTMPTTTFSISSIGFIVGGVSNYFSPLNPVTYAVGSLKSGVLVSNTQVPSPITGNSYTVTGKTISAVPATGYAYQPTLTLTTANINALTGTGTATVNVLVDAASVTKAAATTRYRAPVLAVKMSTTEADYAPVSYDNTQSVVASGGYANECLLYQGSFVGKGTTGAFINYSLSGVGPDLSSTAGNGTGGFTANYRYVNVQLGGGSGAVSTLTVTVTFSGSAALTSVSNPPRQKLQAGGADVDVYFRTVGGSKTSRWIDANSYANGDQINALYPISAAGTALGAQKDGGLAIAGQVVTYTLFIPTVGGFSADNTYVLVGIPDSVSKGVSTITCAYS